MAKQRSKANQEVLKIKNFPPYYLFDHFKVCIKWIMACGKHDMFNAQYALSNKN